MVCGRKARSDSRTTCRNFLFTPCWRVFPGDTGISSMVRFHPSWDGLLDDLFVANPGPPRVLRGVKSTRGKTATTNRSRRTKRIAAIAHKGFKCERCGCTGDPCIFDFHHVDPDQKEAQWTEMRQWSLSRILDEVSKCELLCANCHRLVHWTS